jgi:hypothetical protein
MKRRPDRKIVQISNPQLLTISHRTNAERLPFDSRSRPIETKTLRVWRGFRFQAETGSRTRYLRITRGIIPYLANDYDIMGYGISKWKSLPVRLR